jgi:hypothetical protein
MARDHWIVTGISRNFVKFREESRGFRYGFVPIESNEGSLMTQERQQEFREKGWMYIDSMEETYVMAAFDRTEEELPLSPEWCAQQRYKTRTDGYVGIVLSVATTIRILTEAQSGARPIGAAEIISILLLVLCVAVFVARTAMENRVTQKEMVLSATKNPAELPEFEDLKRRGTQFAVVRMASTAMIAVVILVMALYMTQRCNAIFMNG